MEEHRIRNINELPNHFCFRWGGTGTDVKIYFDTADNLASQLIELLQKGEEIKKSMNDYKAIMAKDDFILTDK